MADTRIIKAIETKDHIGAHELVKKSLYGRLGTVLEEKRKEVAHKTWPSVNLTEDAKSNFNASRRQALREKMLKLKAAK